jgi:hypothetical protein
VPLVEDDEVPTSAVGADGLSRDSRIYGGQLEADDPQVVAVHGVLADCFGGEVAQPAAEQPVEVLDPRGGEICWADDDRALEQAEALHLADVKAGHDRFAGAGLVSEQEAQLGLRKHRPVDGPRAVWEVCRVAT